MSNSVFNVTNELLATLSVDGILRVFDVKKGEPLLAAAAAASSSSLLSSKSSSATISFTDVSCIHWVNVISVDVEEEAAAAVSDAAADDQDTSASSAAAAAAAAATHPRTAYTFIRPNTLIIGARDGTIRLIDFEQVRSNGQWHARTTRAATDDAAAANTHHNSSITAITSYDEANTSSISSSVSSSKSGDDKNDDDNSSVRGRVRRLTRLALVTADSSGRVAIWQVRNEEIDDDDEKNKKNKKKKKKEKKKKSKSKEEEEEEDEDDALVLLRTFNASTDAINCLAICMKNGLLATGSAKAVKLWRQVVGANAVASSDELRKSVTPLATLTTHISLVRTLIFIPKTTLLISSAEKDRHICVWQSGDGMQAPSLSAPLTLLSSDSYPLHLILSDVHIHQHSSRLLLASLTAKENDVKLWAIDVGAMKKKARKAVKKNKKNSDRSASSNGGDNNDGEGAEGTLQPDSSVKVVNEEEEAEEEGEEAEAEAAAATETDGNSDDDDDDKEQSSKKKKKKSKKLKKKRKAIDALASTAASLVMHVNGVAFGATQSSTTNIDLYCALGNLEAPVIKKTSVVNAVGDLVKQVRIYASPAQFVGGIGGNANAAKALDDDGIQRSSAKRSNTRGMDDDEEFSTMHVDPSQFPLTRGSGTVGSDDRLSLSLSDRVDALNSSSRTLKTTTTTATNRNNATRSPSAGVLTAPDASSDNLYVVLAQALRADDVELIDNVLHTTLDKAIESTCQRLSTGVVLRLLRALVERIRTRSFQTSNYVSWLRALLLYQQAQLSNVPNLVNELGPLYQTIDVRLAAYKDVVRLEGRLKLILARSEQSNSVVHIQHDQDNISSVYREEEEEDKEGKREEEEEMEEQEEQEEEQEEEKKREKKEKGKKASIDDDGDNHMKSKVDDEEDDSTSSTSSSSSSSTTSSSK